jgi:hypothetical protein
MSQNIVNHAIILDEVDFGCDSAADISEAIDKVTAYIEESFCCSRYAGPELFQIAVAFENTTNTVDVRDDELGSFVWCDPNEDFKSTMLNILTRHGLEPKIAADFIQSGAIEDVERTLKDQTADSLNDGSYSRARHFLDGLISLHETQLPWVRCEHDFWRSGPDSLFDFRRNNYGVGSRVLFEVGFMWE